MLKVSLDVEEGVQIGDGPENGAAIKVLARTGRRVHLAILTNLRVTRTCFGLHPPVFAPGLAGQRAAAPEALAANCAAG